MRRGFRASILAVSAFSAANPTLGASFDRAWAAFREARPLAVSDLAYASVHAGYCLRRDAPDSPEDALLLTFVDADPVLGNRAFLAEGGRRDCPGRCMDISTEWARFLHQTFPVSLRLSLEPLTSFVGDSNATDVGSRYYLPVYPLLVRVGDTPFHQRFWITATPCQDSNGCRSLTGYPFAKGTPGKICYFFSRRY